MGDVDLANVREMVDVALADYLDRKSLDAAVRNLPSEITEILGDFIIKGGKRVRPLLCVIGWVAAGGHGDDSTVVQAAAALEIFHAFALIHDDLMDASTTRRGRPTVHSALAIRHEGRPDLDRFAPAVALLLGDLALVWSDELLHTISIAPVRLAAAMDIIDLMRTEVMYGQYLDLIATGTPTPDLDSALRIARYKTAKYTVERPLHLGAVLGGANDGVRESLSAFGLPLGEAFQLRDDLLGVFGKPDVTGKSNLDDLREGKHTALMAIALRRAGTTDRSRLLSLVGRSDLSADGAAQVRTILADTGAQATVEHMITSRCHQAMHALKDADLPATAVTGLREIAHATTQRVV
jgi:geranylgeranyl diphosphate synthase type I